MIKKFIFHKKDPLGKINLNGSAIQPLFWEWILKLSSGIKLLDKEFGRKGKPLLANVSDIEELEIKEKLKKDIERIFKLSFGDFTELYGIVFQGDHKEQKFIALKKMTIGYLEELYKKLDFIEKQMENEYILEIGF